MNVQNSATQEVTPSYTAARAALRGHESPGSEKWMRTLWTEPDPKWTRWGGGRPKWTVSVVVSVNFYPLLPTSIPYLVLRCSVGRV